MEEMLIAMYVGRVWSFLAFSEYTTLSKSLHAHQSRSSPNLVLWGIYGGFIAYIGLFKSLAIGDWTQSPVSLPSLEVSG